jgi:hypothetical protein
MEMHLLKLGLVNAYLLKGKLVSFWWIQGLQISAPTWNGNWKTPVAGPET